MRRFFGVKNANYVMAYAKLKFRLHFAYIVACRAGIKLLCERDSVRWTSSILRGDLDGKKSADFDPIDSSGEAYIIEEKINSGSGRAYKFAATMWGLKLFRPQKARYHVIYLYLSPKFPKGRMAAIIISGILRPKRIRGANNGRSGLSSDSGINQESRSSLSIITKELAI